MKNPKNSSQPPSLSVVPSLPGSSPASVVKSSGTGRGGVGDDSNGISSMDAYVAMLAKQEQEQGIYIYIYYHYSNIPS